MLFNSYEFILLFLPLTLGIFFLVGRNGRRSRAVAWLVVASLFYYGWWNPAYLALVLGSVAVNYRLGLRLARPASEVLDNRRALLVCGIVLNLGLLAYFKYTGFLVANLSALTDIRFSLSTVVLPLGISFFTFQQIAYLVDAYRGEAGEHRFLHYCLFVTFFPQLIAGPIVHHQEMLPQFDRPRTYVFRHRNLAVGLTFFVIGLFKKVVLADGVAAYAGPVFLAAQQGVPLTLLEAWGGAVAYTFQLYFDFSGYTDMAIGLARCVGIRLPVNFHSPYKALNFADFWRRWHITLSRFLRDYVYISLGGNRKGPARRYLNLMTTMLIGGLWHGAGWTFVAWGGLHGGLLCVTHGWHALRKRLGYSAAEATLTGRWVARAATFATTVVTWVLFRAESFDGAVALYRAMAGANGVVLPWKALGPLNGVFGIGGFLQEVGVRFENSSYLDTTGAGFLLLLLAVCWGLPNTQEFMKDFRPALMSHLKITRGWQLLTWRPSAGWSLAIAAMAVAGITSLSRVSEFLYYQF
jgi:alginate O-acetyltransferase complex protein AlgI